MRKSVTNPRNSPRQSADRKAAKFRGLEGRATGLSHFSSPEALKDKTRMVLVRELDPDLADNGV